MSWRPERLSGYERLYIPQATAIKDLPAYLHSLNPYGMQTRFHQPEDLSLTATAMTTVGSPFTTTQPREKGTRRSNSDSKAIEIMRQHQQEKTHCRGHTMDERGLDRFMSTKMQTPSSLPRKPPSGAVLPPIGSSIERVSGLKIYKQLEASMISCKDDSTFTDETEDSEEEEEESSENEEDFITDDDRSSDELPQSGLGFRDISHSSFTSLAEVDFPHIPQTGGQLFPTTLIQEHSLLDHECCVTGIPPSGISAGVNNIVRAFEIKGPIDKDLLQTAFTKVLQIHPILSSRFHRRNNKLYIETPQEPCLFQMETPLSYEKPAELITLARRKAFQIPVMNHSLSIASVEPNSCNTHFDFDDRMSIVSVGKEETEIRTKAVTFQETKNHAPCFPKLPSLNDVGNSHSAHMRVKLITKNSSDHILIVSFPCVVCDFWSSCLFIQQLSDTYAQLEKAPSYRPSLAAVRILNKRKETYNTLKTMRNKAELTKQQKITSTHLLPGRRLPPTQVRNQTLGRKDGVLQLICSPRVHFQQVAMRERQVLLIKPTEKLLTYWQSVVTETIKRLRGPPRIKVIPPIRIPNGFGEITRTTGVGRPITGRLRPLTARNRPQTAKRGSGLLTDFMPYESLNGPKKGFHFMKINEKIGSNFLHLFPEEYLTKIDRKELLGLMCLGAYVLLLGKCCRGWGIGDKCTVSKGLDETPDIPGPIPDPLLKYQQIGARHSPVISHEEGSRKRGGRRLDVGSFLIGVEVSIRQMAPELTQGLFGPLSNVVGIRVDLSANYTFADLILSLWRSLHSARCHAHYPFSTIADELGLVQGLPVQFSYLYPHDVQQLSNPNGFYFIETSVGVADKALARFGSSCYMNPLNTKMDDKCQIELMMWEAVRGESVDGLFLYQMQVLRPSIIEHFANEMTRLVGIISENPTILLRELAASINPPFLHTSSRRKR